MSQSKRGFTLIELLVVIAIIAILASILFPVFAKAREKARQTTCLSQIRQMATAIQMYNQDNNGRFPGKDWCGAIASLMGDSTKMFFCPSDAANDAESPVSYGYSGLLLRVDGTGVNEAQIKSPTEVGVVCDASPSRAYPNGGIVYGGAYTNYDDNGVLPIARHSKGIIIGYCDGHAKYAPQDVNDVDMANATTRAFAQAAALGLVDNPAGGTSYFDSSLLPAVTGLMVGGEYTGYPLVQTAAEINKLKGGTWGTRGFIGQNATTGRKAAGPWVWANVDIVAPGAYIARDNLVMIVAKSSKIPGLPTLTNSTYGVNTTLVAQWIDADKGYTVNSIQTYTLPPASKTREQFTNLYLYIGDNAVQVANDVEMVDKVANDPYGLGYCSSAFVDPERVVVLTNSAGQENNKAWPQANKKYRWTMTADPSPDFPTRYIYAEGAGQGATYATSLNSGELKDALQAGPMFKCSYWK